MSKDTQQFDFSKLWRSHSQAASSVTGDKLPSVKRLEEWELICWLIERAQAEGLLSVKPHGKQAGVFAVRFADENTESTVAIPQACGVDNDSIPFNYERAVRSSDFADKLIKKVFRRFSCLITDGQNESYEPPAIPEEILYGCTAKWGSKAGRDEGYSTISISRYWVRYLIRCQSKLKENLITNNYVEDKISIDVEVEDASPNNAQLKSINYSYGEHKIREIPEEESLTAAEQAAQDRSLKRELALVIDKISEDSEKSKIAQTMLDYQATTADGKSVRSPLYDSFAGLLRRNGIDSQDELYSKNVYLTLYPINVYAERLPDVAFTCQFTSGATTRALDIVFDTSKVGSRDNGKNGGRNPDTDTERGVGGEVSKDGGSQHSAVASAEVSMVAAAQSTEVAKYIGDDDKTDFWKRRHICAHSDVGKHVKFRFLTKAEEKQLVDGTKDGKYGLWLKDKLVTTLTDIKIALAKDVDGEPWLTLYPRNEAARAALDNMGVDYAVNTDLPDKNPRNGMGGLYLKSATVQIEGEGCFWIGYTAVCSLTNMRHLNSKLSRLEDNQKFTDGTTTFGKKGDWYFPGDGIRCSCEGCQKVFIGTHKAITAYMRDIVFDERYPRETTNKFCCPDCVDKEFSRFGKPYAIIKAKSTVSGKDGLIITDHTNSYVKQCLQCGEWFYEDGGVKYHCPVCKEECFCSSACRSEHLRNAVAKCCFDVGRANSVADNERRKAIFDKVKWHISLFDRLKYRDLDDWVVFEHTKGVKVMPHRKLLSTQSRRCYIFYAKKVGDKEKFIFKGAVKNKK